MIRSAYAVAFGLTISGVIWLCLTWHDYHADIISGLLITAGALIWGLACLSCECVAIEQRIKDLQDQTASIYRREVAEE